MYLGNAELRAAGEPAEYTPDMIREWAKCKEDIFYFAEKYFYIVNIDKGRMIIPLREYQKRMLKAFIEPPNHKRHVIVLSGRQCGKTTMMTLFILHYLLFNEDKCVACLANKESVAQESIRRVQDAYQALPLWIQSGVKEWSKTKFELENGCRIISGTTSSNSIRGQSVALLCLDEFAHVPNHIAEEFIASVFPTISSGVESKIIMVSTPLGMNHFYETWCKAIRDENSFAPVRINWWEIEGRDEAWREATISDIGQVRFAQEFEAKFLGSAVTLIEPNFLERIGIGCSAPKFFKYSGALRIWEEPVPEGHYILGVDSSMGGGGDYSAIQVLRIKSKKDIEQVAVYECNTIHPKSYARVVVDIAKWYNNAYLIVENNDVGSHVCETIWNELEYDRLLNTDGGMNLGTRSTKKSKLAACMLLKRYLENGLVGINDIKTSNQLSQYEEVSPNVFNAPKSCHDDLVTALLWALYLFCLNDVQVKNDGTIDASVVMPGIEGSDNKQYNEDDMPIFLSDDHFSDGVDADGFDWGGMDK